MRKQGPILIIFICWWHSCHCNYEGCVKTILAAIKLLTNLGFVIHVEKSLLTWKGNNIFGFSDQFCHNENNANQRKNCTYNYPYYRITCIANAYVYTIRKLHRLLATLSLVFLRSVMANVTMETLSIIKSLH